MDGEKGHKHFVAARLPALRRICGEQGEDHRENVRRRSVPSLHYYAPTRSFHFSRQATNQGNPPRPLPVTRVGPSFLFPSEGWRPLSSPYVIQRESFYLLCKKSRPLLPEAALPVSGPLPPNAIALVVRPPLLPSRVPPQPPGASSSRDSRCPWRLRRCCWAPYWCR